MRKVGKLENDKVIFRAESQVSKKPMTVVSEKWLSVIWASIVLVVLSLYVSHIGDYPVGVTLFPRAIGLPTLGLALIYLAREVINLVRSRQVATVDAKNSSQAGIKPSAHDAFTSSVTEEPPNASVPLVPPPNTQSVQIRIVGFGIAIGLALLYILLLRWLGFVLDSVVLIVAGPLLFGQPIRRAPILLIVGTVLVIVLSLLVHLSGVFPLPTGIFHLGVS